MTTDSAQPLLSVRNLRVRFPVRHSPFGRIVGYIDAVDGVSFDLPAGTTLGIAGESGSGKSTLARAILGLGTPCSGVVTFDGVDVFKASRLQLRQVRREMQLVFQDITASLNPRMTIGSSIAEPLAINRIATRADRRRRAGELLERVGLDASLMGRYPHELSGGQRQRIGIARALALEPKLIVFDEPVSALDVSVQAQVLNLLQELQRDLSLTCLFIAHDLAVVRYVSNRVAVMYAGKMVEMADGAELFANPRHPYTAALLASSPRPDPTRRRTASPDQSDAPERELPRAGCSYHPRCAYASDLCRAEAPELCAPDSARETHLAACHHPLELLQSSAAWDAE